MDIPNRHPSSECACRAPARQLIAGMPVGVVDKDAGIMRAPFQYTPCLHHAVNLVPIDLIGMMAEQSHICCNRSILLAMSALKMIPASLVG